MAWMIDEPRLVRDVGEFGLISLLAAALPVEARQGPSLELGIGDDAAVWRPSPGEKVVVTTDSMVEGVHFRRDWTDWESLGAKLLAVNVSDLASMGAVPRLGVITLGLRGDEGVSDLQEMYRGVGAVAAAYEMHVAGGDIVRSPHGLAFHVTALGETRGGRTLSRSGARPGDTIGVSGTLGAAAAGLELLSMDASDPRRQATTAGRLIAAHLRPEPQVALGGKLLELGASAAMDLSDGLWGDLPKILAASGVAARVDTRRIPVAAAVRALFPERWLELATRGGEDYELLFTTPPAAWAAIEEAAQGLGRTVTAIGEVLPRSRGDASIEVVRLDGSSAAAAAGAFDHFAGGIAPGDCEATESEISPARP